MGMFEGLLRDELLARRAGFPSQFGMAEARLVFDVFLSALRR
jgi:hypothetical protein